MVLLLIIFIILKLLSPKKVQIMFKIVALNFVGKMGL